MKKRGRPKKIKEEIKQSDEQVSMVNHCEESSSESGSMVNHFEQCSVTTEQPKEVNIPISDERKQKLNSVLKDINKKVDGVVINYANTIEAKERLSFGYKCLDNLTGGGLLYGNFSTIWGSKGCGKTTVAYKLIATAQKNGKVAVYIDMERSYDPLWAKTFGVDIDALIYQKCTTAEQAMDTILKLCREKVVDLIVLDSIQGLSPHGENYEGKADKEKSVEADTMALLARKLSQFFRMATPAVSDAKCAVLLIGQSRMDLGSFIKLEVLSGGRALMHYNRLILKLRRGQTADGEFEKREIEDIDEKGKKVIEKTQIGFSLLIKVDKAQLSGCTEGDSITTIFNYKKGIKE